MGEINVLVVVHWSYGRCELRVRRLDRSATHWQFARERMNDADMPDQPGVQSLTGQGATTCGRPRI